MNDQWYYKHNERRFGPVTFEALQRLVASGQLRKEDDVWQPGNADPVTASQIPELFRTIKPAPPSAADEPPPFPSGFRFTRVVAALGTGLDLDEPPPLPPRRCAAAPTRNETSVTSQGDGKVSSERISASSGVPGREESAGSTPRHARQPPNLNRLILAVVVCFVTVISVITAAMLSGTSGNLRTSGASAGRQAKAFSNAETMAIPLWRWEGNTCSHNLSDLQKEAVEEALPVWKLTRVGESCYIRCEVQVRNLGLAGDLPTVVVFELRKPHIFVYGKTLADVSGQEATRLNWIAEDREWSGEVCLGAEALRHRWFGGEVGKTSIWHPWSDWNDGWHPPDVSMNGIYRPFQDFCPDLRLEKIQGKWHVLGCNSEIGFEKIAPSDLPGEPSQQ